MKIPTGTLLSPDSAPHLERWLVLMPGTRSPRHKPAHEGVGRTPAGGDGAEQAEGSPLRLTVGRHHRIKLYLCIIRSMAASGRTTPPP